MEKQNNYVEDIINRYVYQVSKHLPSTTRKDIEEELRSLISDMLEERIQTGTPTKKDIDSVLLELGSPYELADKYRDKSHYLISPVIYPTWLLILKIVFGAVLIGITISSILGLLTSENITWYGYLGNCFINLIGGLFMAFAWVTIIFAIIERQGFNIKELVPEWDISSLPPVSKHEVSIPIWEPVTEIVFTIILMLIFILSPQLIGAYSVNDGVKAIPIFDLSVLSSVLPLFLICMGLGILKNIWELIEAKYTIKYGMFAVIINVIEAIFILIIFYGFDIWNPDFLNEISNSFNITIDAAASNIWNIVTSNFAIFLILIYILDAGSTLYKSFKSEGRNVFKY